MLRRKRSWSLTNDKTLGRPPGSISEDYSPGSSMLRGEGRALLSPGEHNDILSKLNCNSQAFLAKRPKETECRKTSADLITAALDMEEDNIKSHRDYLITKEERRRKTRVIKPTTVGPKIRSRSRVENLVLFRCLQKRRPGLWYRVSK